MNNPPIKLVFPTRLILASASPRRRELLQQLGINFEIVIADIDENNHGENNPEAMVRRLARQKAAAVAPRYPDAWVLGADTTVVLGSATLGKPANKKEALAMLDKLSGKTHTVYTGFAIINNQRGVELAQVAASHVTFRTIGKAEAIWYASSTEPYDKAGGYALQGLGAMFVSSIEGSYTNVIGLPLSEVIEALIRLGALTFTKGL